MQAIHFTVPAVPVAQPRAKASAFGGKARMYTPTTIKSATTGERKPHPIVAFKATVRQAFADAYDGPPLQGALYIGLTFVMPRPGSLQWKTKPMPRVPHETKPDCDNLMKSVLDSLSKLAWSDDRQIASWCGEKVIAAGDEQPRVEIVIRKIS